jgi:hypothetical protein
MPMHRAQKYARRVARDNGYDPEQVARFFDTSYRARFACWQIQRGLVVYEDDPDCVVSLATHEDDRLVPA